MAFAPKLRICRVISQPAQRGGLGKTIKACWTIPCCWSPFIKKIKLMLRWWNPTAYSTHSYVTCTFTQRLDNLLKTSGFFTYYQVYYSKIVHGARFALSVLYGSQNRQRLLLYTSLTDWFLQPMWKVFTARYGLIPHIKQITLRCCQLPCGSLSNRQRSFASI